MEAENSTFCKSYDYKINESIHTISYKLHQYMPHSILVLMIQFMLLLLLCTMSNMYVFVIFHSMPWSNFIFPTKLIFIYSHTKTYPGG